MMGRVLIVSCVLLAILAPKVGNVKGLRGLDSVVLRAVLSKVGFVDLYHVSRCFEKFLHPGLSHSRGSLWQRVQRDRPRKLELDSLRVGYIFARCSRSRAYFGLRQQVP